MSTGMLQVQARMAAIHSRFPLASTVPARPAPSSAAAPAFGEALRRAQGAVGGTAFTEVATDRAASSEAAGPWRPEVTGEDVVAAARQYLGVPYLWGGTDPAEGLDCSGFVQRAYRDLGLELPRVSADQARTGRPVESLVDARPGDLMAFDWSSSRPGIDHIGIYIGDNQMIVAPRAGDVVKIEQITRPPVAIRRVLSDSPSPRLVPTGATAPGAVTAGVPYGELFAAAGQRYGLDPALLVAVARAESNFNPSAVSRAGAQGLMQLMPATARGLGVTDAFDPVQAVDGAARLLSSHLAQFGSTELALAAYNAGPGAVQRYGGVPPFSETQRYVARILQELS